MGIEVPTNPVLSIGDHAAFLLDDESEQIALDVVAGTPPSRHPKLNVDVAALEVSVATLIGGR
jgi:hypothetical protein